MTRAYVDTNILLTEAFYARVPFTAATILCSSTVTVVEIGRALRREDPHGDMWVAAHELLDNVDLVDITPTIMAIAANLPTPYLKALDSLHLATALATGADLVVTFDRQMQRACADLGIPTEST